MEVMVAKEEDGGEEINWNEYEEERKRMEEERKREEEERKRQEEEEQRRKLEEEERKRRPPSPEPSTKVSEETESQQQW